MNFLADKSYLAIKPQADAFTPIRPTIHLPLVSESIKLNPNVTADRRMKGLDWKSNDVSKGERMVEGDVTLWGDVDTLAHLFNIMHLKGSTTGSGTDGYTHPFGVGEGDAYTFEIPRGNYAERFFGVRGDKLNLSFSENKMMAKLSIKALGHWYSGTLAVALTGAGMTEVVLNQEFSLTPTKGLAVGDVIIVGGVEVTLTSVDADGITVGFASTAITASVGDAVYLKAQTPSFALTSEPLTVNNTLVGVGADDTAADTAAGSSATAQEVDGLEIEFSNNLLEAKQLGIEGTGRLLNQVRECQVKMKKMFDTPDQHRKWIEEVKQAITIIGTGKFIKSDFTTSEKLTLKFYNVKLTENPQPLNVGGYIFDEQNFEVLYDTGDAKAFDATIVNRIAGTTL